MSILQDLCFALRRIRQRPAVSAVVIATLGLGIGANGILFASLYGSALRPLPFAEPERLVALHESRPQHGETRHDVSGPSFRDWMNGNTVFDGAGAFTWTSYNLQSEEEPYRIPGSQVTAGLFPLLGVHPILGRHFRPEEDRPGGPRVALISHRVWQERLGGDPQVVGRTVRLDEQLHEIVGVMPEGFEFSHFHHIWTPLRLDAAAARRDRRELSVIARLRRGATLDEARRAMDEVAERLAATFPETNEGWGVAVRPLRQAWMPIPAGGELAVAAQLGMVVCVLLIVCANVANVLLAQATSRRREAAVRAALGASRWRLVRLTLVESVVLAVGGGLLGVLLARFSDVWLRAIIATPIPYWLDFGLEARALAYISLVTLLAGVSTGLLPAIQSSGHRLFDSLRSGGAVAQGGGSWLRRSLVVAEYAFALIVLVAGLLMIESFENIREDDRGFASENILTLRLPLTGSSYDALGARAAFLAEAERRLSSLAEVRGVGGTSDLPITLSTGAAVRTVAADGVSLADDDAPRVLVHSVTSGLFTALSIPRRRGRTFTAEEARRGADTVVISESLAELLWPGDDPLHRRLRCPDLDGGPWLEVIGVVGDIEPAQMVVGFGDMPRHRLYLPLAGTASPSPFATTPEVPALVLATRGSPSAVVPQVRRALRGLDPTLPLFEVRSMRRVLDEFYFVQHFWSGMFSAIALLAFVIAAVGVYGVTSYSVSRRSREMGIRAVMGASPQRLLRMVMRQGMTITGIGVAIGLAGAVPLALAMESLLYEMRGLDPGVFASVIGMLAVVGLAASYVAARGAANADPITILRDE